MAASIECRAPFVDHELVEMAAGIPERACEFLARVTDLKAANRIGQGFNNRNIHSLCALVIRSNVLLLVQLNIKTAGAVA